MKLFALIMAPLAFFGNWFCGVPEINVDVYNGTGGNVSIQAFNARGDAKRLVSIPASQSKNLGKCQSIAVTVSNAAPIQFDLPARVRRWVPEATPSGHIRYEFSPDANVKLILVASPYRLETKDEKVSVKLSTGDTVLLPTRSLCFPINPRRSDQSERERHQAFSRQLRKELFQSIEELERAAEQDKKVAPYLEKHTIEMLEGTFGEAPK